MSWISGRTISPASGELVFIIDEDANLLGPQNWVQLWQVCKGQEPIAVADEAIESAEFSDGVAKRQSTCGCKEKEMELLGQHILMHLHALHTSDMEEGTLSHCPTASRPNAH